MAKEPTATSWVRERDFMMQVFLSGLKRRPDRARGAAESPFAAVSACFVSFHPPPDADEKYAQPAMAAAGSSDSRTPFAHASSLPVSARSTSCLTARMREGCIEK